MKPKRKCRLPVPEWSDKIKQRARTALEKQVKAVCCDVASANELFAMVANEGVKWVSLALGTVTAARLSNHIEELCDTFILEDEHLPIYFRHLRRLHAPMCESDARALASLEDQEFAELCDADPAFEPAWRQMQIATFEREIELIEAEKAARVAAARQKLFNDSQRYYEKRNRADPQWAIKNPDLAQLYLGFAPMPDFYDEFYV